MPYIPPEVVEQARQIDLLTYLQSCEPQELVRISGNNYTTRTHDSLKISNGKWMWWSQRIGGYNALDYLVKVRGCSFVEAVETLMGKAAVMPSMTVKPKQKTILPSKYEVIDSPPPCGKDYNDFLCFKLGIHRNKTKERTNER